MRKTTEISLFSLLLICCISFGACNSHQNAVETHSAMLLPNSMENLTETIIRDIYSPPVASRIYAYALLAYYEGIRFIDPQASSIIGRLNGFDSVPQPIKAAPYDFQLVAVSAFYHVGTSLVFSRDSLRAKGEQPINLFKNKLPAETYDNSINLGTAIGEVILKRSREDGYVKSRGMPRFSVYKQNGKWRQTSPDYADAVEPFWHTIHPLLMDSAAQFKPLPPPEYSLVKGSRYFQELMEVYEVDRNRTAEQDTIATYWDDNAFVTRHEGHFMFANKKTTPVGHWLGITSILCRQEKLDELQTAKIFALTASSIFDAFISCWDEKFRSLTVRPVTVIQEEIEADWESFLQTPSFPEYPSGHSVISSAAAVVLSDFIGPQIAFTDTTELRYLGLKRSFPSIKAAAEEAGISRLYGGIHFRAAITEGSLQGQRIGELYIKSFGNDRN